jgi:hypothetical protein
MGANNMSTTLSFRRHEVRGEQRERWVDERVVSRHFGVSTRTVRRWRAMGMPSLLLGGARRYRLGQVERWHHDQDTGA